MSGVSPPRNRDRRCEINTLLIIYLITRECLYRCSNYLRGTFHMLMTPFCSYYWSGGYRGVFEKNGFLVEKYRDVEKRSRENPPRIHLMDDETRLGIVRLVDCELERKRDRVKHGMQNAWCLRWLRNPVSYLAPAPASCTLHPRSPSLPERSFLVRFRSVNVTATLFVNRGTGIDAATRI